MLPLLLSALLPHAQACGGFVPASGTRVASDAQQALYELGSDSITATYRARYAGDAKDFAWVLAVPGGITDVSQGDADRLDAIALASAPVVHLDPAVNEESGCGCGAPGSDGLKGGFGQEGGYSGVFVTGTGFAGNLQYTTLAASDADGLSVWLTDHGYDVSLIQSAVDAYVADPLDYEFVAVQVAPGAAVVTDDFGNVLLDPLQITYGTGADGALHAVFPARLGQSSTVDAVRTEMFVLATGTAAISGWSAPENPDVSDGNDYDVVGPSYEDPNGLLTTFLGELAGDQAVAWQTWTGEYTDAAGESRWLTRYDSFVKPSAETVDAEFTDTTEKTEVDTVIFLQEESAYEAEHPAAWLLPVGLIGLVGLRRRLSRR